MALTLYVDTARWRAHQKQIQDRFPGLIPVCKGNGYGFGHERLCEEATRMGADILAVGTTYEAATIKDLFGGDLLVLTPFRRGEDPVPLPDRVIRSVSSLDGVRGLVGARVVIECMSSMRRHGISEQDLGQLHAAIEDVRVYKRQSLHTMFVSHLRSEDLARLQQQFPQTRFRARIGTRLWLGDHEATEYRGSVLDVTRVAKGDRFGYRQQKAASDGWLVVVAGGTSHGVGLEAPKALHGVMPRAKGVARAGLATVNRNLSPFVWAGKQRWFAEPPHMQVSILFVPSDAPEPKVGDELVAHLRHTTTQFDRVLDA